LQDFALEKEVEREIKQVIGGMGYSLVEVRVGHSRNFTKVSVVIYRKEEQGGVTVGSCESVSKTILPRLELIEGLENMTLEVSSPGLDRVIRSENEYEIFKGKGIKIIFRDTGRVVTGILRDYKRDEKKISVYINQDIEEINISEIRKARLIDI